VPVRCSDRLAGYWLSGVAGFASNLPRPGTGKATGTQRLASIARQCHPADGNSEVTFDSVAFERTTEAFYIAEGIDLIPAPVFV
jgi:hypothetical protein